MVRARVRVDVLLTLLQVLAVNGMDGQAVE